jgi:hypothetical protein
MPLQRGDFSPEFGRDFLVVRFVGYVHLRDEAGVKRARTHEGGGLM